MPVRAGQEAVSIEGDSSIEIMRKCDLFSSKPIESWIARGQSTSETQQKTSSLCRVRIGFFIAKYKNVIIKFCCSSKQLPSWVNDRFEPLAQSNANESKALFRFGATTRSPQMWRILMSLNFKFVENAHAVSLVCFLTSEQRFAQGELTAALVNFAKPYPP